MRAASLIVVLHAFLAEHLAGYPLPDPAAEPGAPENIPARVFIGNVPDASESELPERFPFVVVRWTEGESNENGQNEEEITLVLGVYSPVSQAQAELLTASLADRLRHHIMRNRLLADRYDLQLPLKAAKPAPEDKQHQYHIATITTRWNHATPERGLEGGSYDNTWPNPRSDDWQS